MSARTWHVLLSGCLLLVTTAFAVPLHKGRAYYEARDEIVWEVPTEEKVIALTFDDGPDPDDTPAILDLLRQYEAKATFFVVGKRVQKYPELVIREAMEGHEIANHTFSHPYLTHRDSPDRMLSEMKQAEDIILSITGHKPVLFRPPGGYYSDRLIEISRQLNYRVVLWSWHQDTKDWNSPGVHKIVRKVLKNARSGDIVLFHDFVPGESQTVKALEVILPELKQAGYRFVTVSELLKYRQQPAAGRK